MSQSIVDPLLQKRSDLVVDEVVSVSSELRNQILTDIKCMTEDTRSLIFSAMLKMHKEIEDQIDDLDVSLRTNSEVAENTDAWYVILDSDSTAEARIVRYHYKCNWETSHGVEVIVRNGSHVLFVGNCGYVRSIDQLVQGKYGSFNYL